MVFTMADHSVPPASGHSPIIHQLVDAATHQERAAQLLRLSDGLIHAIGPELRLACHQLRFAAGEHFLAVRMAAVLALRDAHGLLPEGVARQAEYWRETMSRFAASGADPAGFSGESQHNQAPGED